MYGLIHCAMRQCVIQSAGPEAFQKTSKQFDETYFVTSRVYCDEVTVALTKACAGALNLDIHAFLERFGIYWVSYVNHGAYSDIMEFTGRNFFEFVSNLDSMHRAIQNSMPGSVAPHFSIQRLDNGAYFVAYKSKRQGLEIFVKGLLEGLLLRFNLDGVVTLNASHPDGVDYLITVRQS